MIDQGLHCVHKFQVNLESMKTVLKKTIHIYIFFKKRHVETLTKNGSDFFHSYIELI